MLERSALRADSTALLGPGSCRRTRFVRCAHCTQTTAASQLLMRAGARRPRPCAARRPRNRPHRAPPAASATVSRTRAVESHRRNRKGASGQVAARLWSAEKRRACGLARSANRRLTCRSCLNAANEVSAVSSATGPQDQASQGSLREAQTAPVKRCGLPGRTFAGLTLAREADGRISRRLRPSRQGRVRPERARCRRAARSRRSESAPVQVPWLRGLTRLVRHTRPHRQRCERRPRP